MFLLCFVLTQIYIKQTYRNQNYTAENFTIPSDCLYLGGIAIGNDMVTVCKYYKNILIFRTEWCSGSAHATDV